MGTKSQLGKVSNVVKRFGKNFQRGGSSDFFNSNSIVAMFAFLLLVIIVFIVLWRLGVSIITWFMEPDPNPILLKGMADGTHLQIYAQDPKVKDSVPIMRSRNDVTGTEFTWSIWLFMKDTNFTEGGAPPSPDPACNGKRNRKYNHIFHKGNKNFDESGLNSLNNCPGLYLDRSLDSNNAASLLFLINTFDTPTVPNVDAGKQAEEIAIPDIPLNKWMSVIIRVSQQNQLDIYINGTLMKREILDGVVKQNYGDVYLSANGGFHGYSSELRYFNKALGTNDIQIIVDNGPNLKMVHDSPEDQAVPRYLSTRWFFSDSGNLYNPSKA